MSKYDTKHVELADAERKHLPVTYSLIYNFKRKIARKGSAYYGVEVTAYNTTTFYPSGHHKPISKIIDLDVFGKPAES